jgi:hypothetical protein
VPLDERLEPLTFLLAAPHHVRVDPQRERRIGMPELLHHIGRVLADRHQDRGERVPQLVRADPKGQGLQAVLLDQPVRVGHHRVDDILAQVVPRAGLALL